MRQPPQGLPYPTREVVQRYQ